jgi:hypothetical protein
LGIKKLGAIYAYLEARYPAIRNAEGQVDEAKRDAAFDVLLRSHNLNGLSVYELTEKVYAEVQDVAKYPSLGLNGQKIHERAEAIAKAIKAKVDEKIKEQEDEDRRKAREEAEKRKTAELSCTGVGGQQFSLWHLLGQYSSQEAECLKGYGVK